MDDIEGEATQPSNDDLAGRPYYSYRVDRVIPSYKGRADLPVTLRVETIDGGPPELPPPPRRLVTTTGGRILWTKDNTIADRKLMYIQQPDFPVAELFGKRLIPLAPFGGPDAMLFAVVDDTRQEGTHA